MRRGLALCACVLLAACGDEDPAPRGTISAAEPLTLDPSDDLADDLTLLVEYRDADGDLGEGWADVIDCRAEGLVTRQMLDPIASAEAVAEGVPIEGTLELTVPDIGHVEIDAEAPAACRDLGVAAPVEGSAVFCLILEDAAGHRGPGDCTEPIAITPPP